MRAKDRIRVALTAVASCIGMVIGNVLIAIAKSIPAKMIAMVLSKAEYYQACG